MKYDEQVKKVLFEKTKVTKGERTKNILAQIAKELICEDGFENLTFESVALRAKVTRQLVQKYFPERSLIIAELVPAIRLAYQEYVLARMAKATTPKEMFKEYCFGAMEWINQSSQESKIWTLFYHYCSRSENFKSLNTELVGLGTARIKEMIRYCSKSEVTDLENRAQIVQMLLTGAGISMATQTGLSDTKDLKEQVWKTISDWIGA